MKTKLLIFGITGDLGRQKLLPALEQIISTGDFNDLSIIGVSRHEVNVPDLLVNCNNKGLFNDKLSVYTMNLDDQNEYFKLKDYLELGDDEQLLVYLAVPPKAVGSIVDMLGNAGLNTANVKILFEKPFGIDLASAQNVAELIKRHYSEDQTYRIDHYMAKEMAQNIVTIRGKNALFSSIWNNRFIESIDIVALEAIGIEGRANFYEQTGALRDVVQGHLMQLLALSLLNIPTDFTWEKLPELRLAALRQLQPANPAKAVRAQYEGYRDEAQNPDSKVETFVSLELTSSQPEWVGVPIRLITGKGLNKKTTEIRIRLKKTNDAQNNYLVFRIQPNEGIDIELFVKKPGYSNDLEEQHLVFNYPADAKLPDAYEQVIVDAISTRKSLFTTSDEVLESWKILQPVQENWANIPDSPKSYSVGSDIMLVLA